MPSLMTWTSTSWPRRKMSWISGLGRPAPGPPPLPRPRPLRPRPSSRPPPPRVAPPRARGPAPPPPAAAPLPPLAGRRGQLVLEVGVETLAVILLELGRGLLGKFLRGRFLREPGGSFFPELRRRLPLD